jgi:hypothetical protein
MRLTTLALVFGVAALGSKVVTRQAQSLKNRYESNYAATWTAINGLTALTAPLDLAQVTFLASVNPMTTPLFYPLAPDTNTGPSWAAGERDFVTGSSDGINSVIQKLQRSNLMA